MIRMTSRGGAAALEETARAEADLATLDCIEEVPSLIEAHMRQRFATLTAPDGTPWEERADGSAARLGRIGETVFATRSGPDRVRYGAYHEAASYHQDGTDTVPARPFAPTAETAPELVESIGEAIERALSEGPG